MAHHEQSEQGRQTADEKQILPAERNDPPAHEGDRDEADREDEFEQQHEPAAAARLGKLADIGRGHRYLGAEAEPLENAQHQERFIAPGPPAGEAEDSEPQHRDDDQGPAADPLGKRATDQRADELAEKTRRDQPADRTGRELPGRHDCGQHISDSQRIEGVEEGRSANNDAGSDLPG